MLTQHTFATFTMCFRQSNVKEMLTNTLCVSKRFIQNTKGSLGYMSEYVLQSIS